MAKFTIRQQAAAYLLPFVISSQNGCYILLSKGGGPQFIFRGPPYLHLQNFFLNRPRQSANNLQKSPGSGGPEVNSVCLAGHHTIRTFFFIEACLLNPLAHRWRSSLLIALIISGKQGCKLWPPGSR